MYPADEIPGYSRDEFIQDLLAEHEKEIRRCFAKGAKSIRAARCWPASSI
jgi:5-methyltetrahydropteroyltriglutamate--homocysteine methyltransferase